MSSELKKEMEARLRFFNRGAYGYAIAYYVTRTTLIITSALVASEKALEPFWFASALPLIAILVAVLTALDTWMKPLEKWRGFTQSRDEMLGLMSLFQEGTSHEEIRTRFMEILRQHRERNLF